MNAKQAAPLAATVAAAAPQLFFIGAIGCGIYFGLKWLFPDDNKSEKPENPPMSATPECKPPLNPPNSAGNLAEHRGIPAYSAENVTTPPLAVTPATSAPAPSKIPVSPPSIIPTIKIAPEIPPPQKKIISHEDMAKIFSGGRRLTRKSAVSALKALGFGKSAAYEALVVNGRFASRLEFAPDGIIIWKMDVK